METFGQALRLYDVMHISVLRHEYFTVCTGGGGGGGGGSVAFSTLNTELFLRYHTHAGEKMYAGDGKGQPSSTPAHAHTHIHTHTRYLNFVVGVFFAPKS